MNTLHNCCKYFAVVVSASEFGIVIIISEALNDIMLVFVVSVASDTCVLVVTGDAVTFEVVDFNPFSTFSKYGVEVCCVGVDTSVDIAVCAMVGFAIVIIDVVVVLG